MVALLEHVWGVSRAADRVWAQVTGLRPSIAGKRWLMVLQAFIDDSYSFDSGVYVLAGHIASAETWATFSKEWEQLLPFAPIDREGRRNFKMREMVLSPERLENLQAFYRAIERHVLCSLSLSFRFEDLQRAKARIRIPGRLPIEWGPFENNFMFAFISLMRVFHSDIPAIRQIMRGEKVDFFFDRQSEQKQVAEGWYKWLERMSDAERERFGSSPRFEDDQKFLPIQAADFLAWYVRVCIEEGRSVSAGPPFGWKKFREFPHIHMATDEREICLWLAQEVANQNGAEVRISSPPSSWGRPS